MPTWEGDPRPIEDDRRSYHDVRDEPVLVRQINTQDALEAFVAVFWELLVLAWCLLVIIVKFIIWVVRKIRGTSNVARRSSRRR